MMREKEDDAELQTTISNQKTACSRECCGSSSGVWHHHLYLRPELCESCQPETTLRQKSNPWGISAGREIEAISYYNASRSPDPM